MNYLLKSKFKLINYRTLKWKKAIDDCEKFVDDKKLPSVLVQNKIDLVDEETKNNITKIKEFQNKNEFDNFFRTSVKMNINVTETMNYLIETIIDRMEKFSTESGAPIGQRKKKEIVVPGINIPKPIESPNIKLDSKRLITKSSKSKSKSSRISPMSLHNPNINDNNQQNEWNIGDYVPDCCGY
ncbi:MAG: hypothetical protein MJ252_08605 [archaeon]|nr:hypothetical protein [archaeon]